MKAPMQKMIDELRLARQMCDDPSMEMDIWHTLDVLIAKAEVLREIEKEVMVDFAYKYGDLTLRQISDAYDHEYIKLNQ